MCNIYSDSVRIVASPGSSCMYCRLGHPIDVENTFFFYYTDRLTMFYGHRRYGLKNALLLYSTGQKAILYLAKSVRPLVDFSEFVLDTLRNSHSFVPLKVEGITKPRVAQVVSYYNPTVEFRWPCVCRQRGIPLARFMPWWRMAAIFKPTPQRRVISRTPCATHLDLRDHARD